MARTERRGPGSAQAPAPDYAARCALRSIRATVVRSLRFFVGVDQVAGLVLGRVEDHLAREVAEGVDAVALDALELHQQHAFGRPLALVAELHVADHGLKGGLADVV